MADEKDATPVQIPEVDDLSKIDKANCPGPSTHHIVGFEGNGGQGRLLFEAHCAVGAADLHGANGRVSSIRIDRGSWALYEHNNYQGRRLEFGPNRPGDHYNLADWHFDKQLSSFRAITD